MGKSAYHLTQGAACDRRLELPVLIGEPRIPRLNIVLILIDDLGWRDLACYGSTFYETPNPDRLVAEGMRFTRAYAACPVCSPTRASILSGKYPARIGLTNWIPAQAKGRLADVPYLHYLPLEEVSVAAALREGGYQTWHVGKWRLGDEPFRPEKHGFDVNLGGCHWGRPMRGYFSPYGIETLPDGPDGEYLTDRLTEEAIRLIRGRDADRPFFLNLCHYAAHTPIQAPEPLVEQYRRKARRLGLDQIPVLVEGGYYPFERRKNDRRRRRMFQSDPTYAVMIENLDTNIGRVLQALEEEGLADDTLVVFTSHNGGLASSEGAPTCNLPLLEGKGWNYEGGTRVCEIVRWPGRIAPNSLCETPVTSTDLYPTFLEATGLPLRPGQHVDGVSLLSLLEGAGRLAEREIFWHYPHYSNQGNTPAGSVVLGDWKLIEFFETGKAELYNLAEDVSEQQDLSASRPEIARDLVGRLRAWQREVEAKIPEPNPDWPPRVPDVPNNAHE